jgi:mitochondrial chaperone BCS1
LTGKTSLSFALAGIFGLDIHVISLLDTSLTEETLANLMNQLPRRCIVLLEDIDTAGLVRDKKDSSDSESDVSKNGNDEKFTMVEVVKALKNENNRSRNKVDKPQGVSLSGLLNAIDGVASHEGRVLVMTTNHPEKLDDALIRPGRVDMQIQFKLASCEQARELFVRMYSDFIIPVPSSLKLANGEAKKPVQGVDKTRKVKDGEKSTLTAPFSETLEKVKRLALLFATKIPEGKFSPAEIQGFLLMRKKQPEKALADVEEWSEALLETKRMRSKIVTMN